MLIELLEKGTAKVREALADGFGNLFVTLGTKLTSEEDSVESFIRADVSLENQVISVANTATKLPATPLANRKALIIRNIGAQTVYLGKSDVTAGTTAATGGYPVYPNESFQMDLGASVDLYGIVVSGTCNVALIEVS